MRTRKTASSGKEVTSLTANPALTRSEIWIVGLDPTKGSEMRKTRPAVILSSDGIGKLPIRLVAPITGWKPKFEPNIWHIHLSPTDQNGLRKESEVDVLQVRGIDTSRCQKQIGRVGATTMEEIVTALAAVVEYQ